MFGNRCIHSPDSLMDFSEAVDYCQRQDGAKILHLGSYEVFNAFKGYNIPGMYNHFDIRMIRRRITKIHIF